MTIWMQSGQVTFVIIMKLKVHVVSITHGDTVAVQKLSGPSVYWWGERERERIVSNATSKHCTLIELTF